MESPRESPMKSTLALPHELRKDSPLESPSESPMKSTLALPDELHMISPHNSIGNPLGASGIPAFPVNHPLNALVRDPWKKRRPFRVAFNAGPRRSPNRQSNRQSTRWFRGSIGSRPKLEGHSVAGTVGYSLVLSHLMNHMVTLKHPRNSMMNNT